ncbi:MAG: toprim domain-containing protein [Pseudomonadota bacterium]
MNNKVTLENLEFIISYISAVDRDICIRVAMGIKSEFGDSGYDTWNYWLQTDTSYNQREMLAVWKSIKLVGAITIATVIYMAKENGFEFSSDTPKLSQDEIDKRNGKRQAREVEAKKAFARKKYYAKESINKILPELLQTGAPMIRYLFNRGLGLFKTPDSVMFNPSTKYWENGKFILTPAIVSLITDINGHVEALHKIHLTNNGYKAKVDSPKKISTPINSIKGCSIKFEWPNDILFLTEGLEDALAIWIETKQPVWACISAYGLQTVEIPGTVKLVYIMADKDRTEQGEKSANILAQRLISKGVIVHILLPEQDIPNGAKSIDWLDIYNLEKQAA